MNRNRPEDNGASLQKLLKEYNDNCRAKKLSVIIKRAKNASKKDQQENISYTNAETEGEEDNHNDNNTVPSLAIGLGTESQKMASVTKRNTESNSTSQPGSPVAAGATSIGKTKSMRKSQKKFCTQKSISSEVQDVIWNNWGTDTSDIEDDDNFVDSD